MNITWRLLQRPDHQWGVRYPNGTFGGMIGSIHRGDADLVAASISLTLVRQVVADFAVRLSTYKHLLPHLAFPMFQSLH